MVCVNIDVVIYACTVCMFACGCSYKEDEEICDTICSIKHNCLGPLGFCYRVYMFGTGADWSSQVYVPFYANLDLYISGILLNYLKIPKMESERKKLLFGSLIKAAFVIGIIINCYIAYRADYSTTYLFVYQYVLPSFYLVGVCIYIFVAEMCYLPQERLNCRNLMKNPFRLLDLFRRDFVLSFIWCIQW